MGDSGIANPIAWRIVSSLAVKHKPLEDGSQPAAPGKLAAYTQFATKPTIVHIQRQPDKRAPPALSLLFAGLTLTPLLVLIWMLGQLGVNFKVSTRGAVPLPDWQCRPGLIHASFLQGFPSSGPAALCAGGFHTGIAAILVLYALFWFRLNLLQTLPLLAGLGVFTSVVGYRVLSHLSDHRQKSA